MQLGNWYIQGGIWKDERRGLFIESVRAHGRGIPTKSNDRRILFDVIAVGSKIGIDSWNVEQMRVGRGNRKDGAEEVEETRKGGG